MIRYTSQLHEDLTRKLNELDHQYDPNNLIDQRLEIIVETIEKIKEKLTGYRFESEETEINFFKSVLPQTLALYVYYTDKIKWDRIRVRGSQVCKYHFTDRIYSQAETFRTVHKGFYEYCRDAKTQLDRFYFLRDSPGNHESVYSPRTIIDRSSPTVYCEMYARLIAYTRLEQELHQRDADSVNHSTAYQTNKSILNWRLPKIFLIELIYALKEIGAFGDNADLSMIQECFEKMFGISLGNISRSFQEILARKKGHTAFLDRLKEFLMKRILKMEESNFKSNRS